MKPMFLQTLGLNPRKKATFSPKVCKNGRSVFVYENGMNLKDSPVRVSYDNNAVRIEFGTTCFDKTQQYSIPIV